MNHPFPIRRLGALLLCLVLAAALLPVRVSAQGTGRTVRVGWYESPFNKTDELGRRSGYAYEYQQKLAAFTGWTYEYVEGSWPELLQMLKDGRIDLLSDVSRTEERAGEMLFSSLPMGSEEYYVFVAPDEREITLDDLSTLNGKTVGANRGSVQADFFREWAAANGVDAELVEMTQSVDDSLDMLRRGAIDMYVALDAYLDMDRATPLVKVGASDFYFAVSLDAAELLPELNAAMNRILADDPNFNLELTKKHLHASGANYYLTAEERDWLDAHGPIRVGYQDNYLSLCGADKTGALTGALKDYLLLAADALENGHLDFTATAYPTSAAAIEAMKRGEVDCVFPVNLTDYDGEAQGLLISPALMRTDMSAVIRETDAQTFFQKDRVAVAVNVGNPNYDMFLLDHFPDWRSVYYKDTAECLRAVSERQADCILISNYRYNNIAALCRRYHLTTVSTGVEMDYYFAVNRGETLLYSILSKAVNTVPASSVSAALSAYFAADAQMGLGELLLAHLDVVIAVAAGVGIGFLVLLLFNYWMEKKSRARQALIDATQTDELSGLYSRNYFYEYAGRLRSEHPDRPMDAIALNIEHFHSINALKGEAFGNQTLQVLGTELHAFLQENGGVGSREESDHFSVYCPRVEDTYSFYLRLQGALDKLSPNTSIRLRMGVAPWDRALTPEQQLEQARVACALARGSYTEHMVVFDAKVRQREERERRLLHDLRRALESREFEVYYQPKYDVRGDEPVLISAEALVRWRHPELGLLSPGEFIPLFERSGEIGPVDRYVWTETARQIAVWKAKYGVSVPVSVNLSRVDLFDSTLENVLDALLADNGLSCADLRLEVTESACSENSGEVADVIARLRGKGFVIEMDDFGTGYSSLNMLSGMPVDVLKMDRAFVSNIEHSEKDLQLIRLIMGIAADLNIAVIAEGVETEGQLRLLRSLGCGLVQGYYFSRPLPPEVFEERVMKGRA